jgi:hypothetical protein
LSLDKKVRRMVDKQKYDLAKEFKWAVNHLSWRERLQIALRIIRGKF